jgi:transcriptional regulator with XRE-family HTH domain
MTGNEFKKMREDRGLTMEEVSSQIGIAWQNVQKWEAKQDEEASIKSKYWAILGQVLGCAADEFASKQGGINASGNSIVVSGGRDANYKNKVLAGNDIKLTPLELQVILLNRDVGNNKMLRGFLNRLLEMQKIAENLY